MYYCVCSVTHIFNFFYCNPIDYPSREYCRKMKTTLIYWYTVKELINSIQNEFFLKKIIGFKKRKNICQTHCEFPYICIQTIYFTNKIDRVCILKSQNFLSLRKTGDYKFGQIRSICKLISDPFIFSSQLLKFCLCFS